MYVCMYVCMYRRGFRGGAGRAAVPPFAGIFVRDL